MDDDFLDPLSGSCICLTFRRTAHLTTQFYDQMLAPAGVTIRQYSMLVIISEHDHLSIKEAAVLFKLDRTTLSRNLKPLEREGWIEIQTGEDRRSRQIILTGKGRSTVMKATPMWQEAQKRMLAVLGQENWQEIRQTLDRANTALAFSLSELF
ncbi:MarR family winged helix-turn-helix transcriptional regulator [Aestuariispira ectoiniformans]|uniref:MarR family winged helix-turn-helix transcriptional regulator n=1 Tax=Aestuariispira ectoiniformans TaxID=2775080 RepID=UPI00223BEC27|nr:MarR family winged helix-turn-helix transcriptional regulator [Aestuariispira ectoiniformans]